MIREDRSLDRDSNRMMVTELIKVITKSLVRITILMVHQYKTMSVFTLTIKITVITVN